MSLLEATRNFVKHSGMLMSADYKQIFADAVILNDYMESISCNHYNVRICEHLH